MDRRKKDQHWKLGRILQNIYKKNVVLEPNHQFKRKALDFFLSSFKKYSLETSPAFRKTFQDFYYTGSYFEGLRVSEATEFDVNVVFTLTHYNIEYEVKEMDAPVSYATLQLKCSSSHRTKSDPVESLFDEEKYLMGDRVRAWFHSLVVSFLKHSNLEYHQLPIYQVKLSHSGPARTLKVLYDSVWISIDLVPVFQINVEQVQKCQLENVDIPADCIINCVLVPKPLDPELCCQSELPDRAWRIHFPELEKQIIKQKESLKPIIKLVKDLRDKEKWPIPSYFIKVAAIWLVLKHPHQHYWNSSRFGSLFLQFLESLEKHFCDNYLGHVLYPTFNLFHALKPRTLKLLQTRIQKIISDLKKNPGKAYIFFKVYG